MDLTKKLRVLVFVVSVLITVRHDQTAETDRRSVFEEVPSVRPNLESAEPQSDGGAEELLTYDFYSTSCPSAERIIRTTVRELHEKNSSVGPALLRLAFHDCFVMAGGQFYPVFSGRMDRKMAFPDNATIDLPSPNAKLFNAHDSFAANGFNARETVALLGIVTMSFVWKFGVDI